MSELVARFVAAFKRGIEGEVAAMQASSGSYDIPLTHGEELGPLRYSFEAPPHEQLVAGVACTMRTGAGEQRVVIERVEEGRVRIAAMAPIDVAAPATLVMAPWFLYERLVQALDRLQGDQPVALRLFGKAAYTKVASTLRGEHAALDPSQRAAVQLCSDSDLAFVWGPPGTGKTVTLTHVIEELVAQGKRILLASNTNAAIDQALSKLAARPWFQALIESGCVVRLGRSDAETFGTELRDVVERVHGRAARLRARIGEVDVQLRAARALVDELVTATAPQQSLFSRGPSGLTRSALAQVFSDGLAAAIARRDVAKQLRALELRARRLERVRRLSKAQLESARDLEGRVVGQARIVMCTLTSAYLSPLMSDQRFDVLIAEEAGMATLPTLFYAASLCRERAVVVGDPRQLPPIVQSDDERVRRSIGRNIFDVTVPDPEQSEIVAMLDVQYRMHPTIGGLVGSLFYGGRLHHAARGVEPIADGAPFAGRPLVVVDTQGRTTCERSAKGSSRVNVASAEITADLALEAVRARRASSIAVITPYAAQAGEIRRRLAARRIGDAVECSTIHRFQGRECDVVIIDLVDAAPMRQSSLLAEAPNLLNVSLSRARGKLVIVADVAYFGDGLVAAMLRAATAVERSSGPPALLPPTG